MKQAAIILYFILFMATDITADEPKVVVDGRTWIWDAKLGMHRPEGTGWNYDATREVWWREVRKVGDKKSFLTNLGNQVEFVWNGKGWVPTDPCWVLNVESGYYVRPLKMNKIGATDPNPPGQIFYGIYQPPIVQPMRAGGGGC